MAGFSLWAVITVIFIFVELFTDSITVIWFAAGSIFAMFAAVLYLPFWTQLLVFVFISAVSLYLFYRFVKQKIQKNPVKTNVNALPGMVGVVTEMIHSDISEGTVKVNGMTWLAQSEDGQDIDAGNDVVVVRVEGAHLVVKPIMHD